MSRIAQVAISPLKHPFTYLVPQRLSDRIQVGSKVITSFGRRKVCGYVVELLDKAPNPDIKLKPILDLMLKKPSFLPEQLQFFLEIAAYYGQNLSQVLEVALPPEVKEKKTRFYCLVAEPSAQSKSKKRQAILNYLRQHPNGAQSVDLNKAIPNASSQLKKLKEEGVLEVQEREPLPDDSVDNYKPTAKWAKRSVELMQDQREALQIVEDSLKETQATPILLYGITGSGKTEVYIEAIKKLSAAGRGSLVLVPEIALTPQLLERFKARLGENLVTLHSAMSARARWQAWQKLLCGECLVAIGVRSAIFAPIKDLSLIIVDEEHDSSYKQNDTLRYNARDLAILRAKLCRAGVVLGSATPSLESYSKAKKGDYRAVSLRSRFGKAAKPKIELVDLTKLRSWDMASPLISPQLHTALKETAERKEQAFLLYNRRGFAAYMQCDSCGNSMVCDSCSVTLTYHQSSRNLLCHYCGKSYPLRLDCPNCAEAGDSGSLIEHGGGTERVFDELKELFPEVKIARLDRDTARSESDFRGLLSDLHARKTTFLVGTQMIAKGHDLPGVTLVGIIDADVGLHLPDFRASEHNFQLLVQAAGRAGRHGERGQVILQTRNPQALSISCAAAGDHVGFVNAELQNRQELGYPPFSRLLRVIVRSKIRDAAQQRCEVLAEAARKLITKEKIPLYVKGPAPAPIQKTKDIWRYHFLVKGSSPSQLNRLMLLLQNTKYKSSKIQVAFDMDPYDMM